MPAEKTPTVAEAEATDTPTKFEHNGIEYTVPAPLDFPLDVIHADNDVQVAALVLGEEQWAKYKATKPTIRDFQAFYEKLNGSSGN